MGVGDNIDDPNELAGIPLQNGEPLMVAFGYVINEISNISSADSTFDVDMYVQLEWNDHRLVSGHQPCYAALLHSDCRGAQPRCTTSCYRTGAHMKTHAATVPTLHSSYSFSRSTTQS